MTKRTKRTPREERRDLGAPQFFPLHGDGEATERLTVPVYWQFAEGSTRDAGALADARYRDWLAARRRAAR